MWRLSVFFYIKQEILYLVSKLCDKEVEAMEEKTIESLGFYRDGKIFIIDDDVTIPDWIENMPKEERERRIKILEEKGRKEGMDLPEPKPLLLV